MLILNLGYKMHLGFAILISYRERRAYAMRPYRMNKRSGAYEHSSL